LLVLLLGGAVLMVVVAVAVMGQGQGTGLGPKVALINIEGVITAGAGGSGLFGGSEAGSVRIVQLIRQAEDDSGVKAVVLRINSPGGSAAGSQEVYQAVMRLRDSGKPVVVSMGDVAASGGYYIASAADAIVANGSTLTGSIGVIWSSAEFDQLFQKIGIRSQVIKSGKFKDIGSSNRPMTDEERKLLQGLINDVFDQFVQDVAKGRGMPVAQVRKLADGRVFTGRQAKAYRLVDEIGSLHDAVRLATWRAHIPKDSRVVELGRRTPLQYLMGDTQTMAKQRLLDRLLYSELADRLTQSTQ
jgi:protease-4